MATRRKKSTPADLAGNTDPRAPLDGAALLDVAKPLLKELAADLLKRADDSRPVTEALQARHAQEQKAERTADGYPEWRRALVEQVAAAWLLSCVFVRTLEDRGLLGKNRIAGPGAQDSWKVFLQLAPSLSEREYLLTVFRELGRLPAVADVFDARHNPVWLLAPSAEGARKLLDLFHAPNVDTPKFRFGGEDTHFLGDLYQNVSEDVRKRYALLQTPPFIQRFILDRTLEPAIERFGLDDTNLIDPTCGSGHFLLGAFERLFDHRLRIQPGLNSREAATKALDSVAGADINPYAIAIARFRLTLAFIEKCGLARLKDVPRLPLHLAVADSLLYNPHVGQLALVEGTDPARWEGSHLSLEDPNAARDVLFKQYAAVVGNPPYITVKDAVLRERYRSYYPSAFRSYSVAVPFTERFFQLGRTGARVGMITANSFMKREFGRLLIEKYLPSVNLDLIVNTSGAYIPGHGTPTVLLFAANEKPKGATVRAVLANRGEPSTPNDPEAGAVWSSIVNHWREDGFENDYISVAQVHRDMLSKHPWSLGGGGTSDLKELLEEKAVQRLGDLSTAIGRSTHTGEDSFFFMSASAATRLGVPAHAFVPLVTGEQVRDWSLSEDEVSLFPYDKKTGKPRPPTGRDQHHYWIYRTTLRERQDFGQKIEERGLKWFEHSMFFPQRFLGAISIAFAFVATHNHFVLDRGGKVFNRSAPVIKLPETATEDDHFALIAYLNSSVACFWMKQVFMPKGSTASNRNHPDPARAAYEFAGTALTGLPVPPGLQDLVPWAMELTNTSARRSSLIEPANLNVILGATNSSADFDIAISRLWSEWDFLRRRLVFLQEEIDWRIYRAFDLVDDSVCSSIELIERGQMGRRERPFADRMGTSFVRHDGAMLAFDDAEVDTASVEMDEALVRLNVLRRAAIGRSPELAIIEDPVFKRLWRDTEMNVPEAHWRSSVISDWLCGAALDIYERLTREGSPVLAPVADKESCLPPLLLDLLGGRCGVRLTELVAGVSVPFLGAHTYTECGIEKHNEWQATWKLQRREDGGEPVTGSAAPPKYDQTDFRDGQYFSLRGKLDVPKERFISYPGCESDEDKEPMYGWAGWDHLQRAVALAGLYQDRKQREGWTKDRLMPMLAGLLELLPWLKQWHHEPSAELGGERPSDQFEAFLNAECNEFGFTYGDLHSWRPIAKVRGGKPKKAKAAAVAEDLAGES
ncbi:MAG: BREX-2 system adenine-specific DNA-methyltransferase PglX [Pseudomonadota bacterium]